MVNALTYAATIADTLPHNTRTPETTDGRDGFLHLYKTEGTAADCTMHFILRDFEREGLEAHGELLRSILQRRAVERATSAHRVHDHTAIPQHALLAGERHATIDLATQAMHDLGIEPANTPVRGGTDGSQLTEMGVPCPNVFTGMQAIHTPVGVGERAGHGAGGAGFGTAERTVGQELTIY